MINLEYKSIENAHPISSEHMRNTNNDIGMIPNMYAGMANNPALLDAYVHSYNTFRENSGFSPQEQEVVFLSIAYENECNYCVAAHSFVADKMSNVPIEVTNAIRNNDEVSDKKLKALSIFSKQMVAKRGNPSLENIEDFFKAGYAQNDILGVIAGIGVKTMSNYFNHVFKTPVDTVFSSRIWKK